MRYAFVSDIHSNLQAWEAVLADMTEFAVDRIVCLGDVIGYGPSPAECLNSVRKHASVILRGNHDAAAAGIFDMSDFSDIARHNIEWTKLRLDQSDINTLASLPLTFAESCFCCAHGGFAAPGEFNYILTEEDAVESWEATPEPLLFTGHTHLPVIFVKFSGGVVCALPPQDFMMEPGFRYIVNPGSVGSPRDSDLRACYVIFDEETKSVVFRRVPYEFSVFCGVVRSVGLKPSDVPILCNVFKPICDDAPENLMETASAASVNTEAVNLMGRTVIRKRADTAGGRERLEKPFPKTQPPPDKTVITSDAPSRTVCPDTPENTENHAETADELFVHTVKISDIELDSEIVPKKVFVRRKTHAANLSSETNHKSTGMGIGGTRSFATSRGRKRGLPAAAAALIVLALLAGGLCVVGRSCANTCKTSVDTSIADCLRIPDSPVPVYGYRSPKAGPDGNRLRSITGITAGGLGDYRVYCPKTAGVRCGIIGSTRVRGLVFLSEDDHAPVFVDTPFLKFGKNNKIEIMAAIMPFEADAGTDGDFLLSVMTRDETSGAVRRTRTLPFRKRDLPKSVRGSGCFAQGAAARGWLIAYAELPSPGSEKTLGLRLECRIRGKIGVGGFVMRRRR